jgi:hypothetical protein
MAAVDAQHRITVMRAYNCSCKNRSKRGAKKPL